MVVVPAISYVTDVLYLSAPAKSFSSRHILYCSTIYSRTPLHCNNSNSSISISTASAIPNIPPLLTKLQWPYFIEFLRGSLWRLGFHHRLSRNSANQQTDAHFHRWFNIDPSAVLLHQTIIEKLPSLVPSRPIIGT